MKLNNIRKKYNENIVLDGINFLAEKNGLLFILGVSGSGKSTFLNIAGLLEDDYEGAISYIGEEKITTARERTRYRKEMLGFVFQEFNLIHSLTVKENIVLSLDIAGKPFLKEKYDEIIGRLGIRQLEQRMVDTLSGGEKQRVAIARALLRESKIIFADEPTGNLDAKNSETIFSMLKEISKECLIIVVTHNEKAAEEYGDRIVYMEDGRIIKEKEKGYEKNTELKKEYQTDDKENQAWIGRLSYKNFTKNKKKRIPIIFIMLLLMISLGIIMGVYSGMSYMASNVNSDMLENDKYSMVVDFRKGTWLEETLVMELNEFKSVKYVNPYYYDSLELKLQGESYDFNLNVINNSDFIKERFSSLLSRKELKETDIVINEQLAQTLFHTKDCLGKTVTLGDLFGHEYSCKVVAVKENGISNKNNLYINQSLLEKVRISTLESEYLMYRFSDNEENQIKIQDWKEKEKVILGRKPEKWNEAVISAASLNTILHEIDASERLYSMDEILKGKMPEKVLSLLYDADMIISNGFSEMAQLHIVGVIKSDSKEELELFIREDFKTKYNKPHYNQVDIYMSNIMPSEIETLQKLADKYQCRLVENSSKSIAAIGQKISIMMIAFVIIVVIFLIISIMMINSSIKLAFNDRIYEIGVLKSLGASNQSIFRMLISENLVLGISIAAITIILLEGIQLTSLFTIDNVIIYQMQWWNILVVALVSLGIPVISSLGQTIKISRLSIVDAIRTKNN